MLRGMTGYGKATSEGGLPQVTVELSSLNRRHFELRAVLPPQLTHLEPELRRQIQEGIARGAISLVVRISNEEASPAFFSPNLSFLHHVKRAARQVAQELDISSEAACNLILRGQDTSLLHQPSVDIHDCKPLLLEALSRALKELLRNREAEGKAIAADFTRRLTHLNELHKSMLVRAPAVVVAYQNQLLSRLKALQIESVNQERLLSEIALQADKCDISEELTRLEHHLNQMVSAIQSSEVVGGKALEFRLQEISREMNTLGSKAGDIALAELVVAAKIEIEKIREQLQNVE